ncbi:hypothetical protein GYMLUDRAFT_236437 [Collybiopsis luxurians FD-317 M1]|nr:hypothetical protein GYMLUDRAFT_236437 [Collybiopsis luxurians FD-317 M1]
MTSIDLPLISDAADARDTTYVAFVGFTILIWDHLDTFTTEVEYIWPRIGEKQPIVYLFLINRYLIPLSFIVNLFGEWLAFFTGDNDVEYMLLAYLSPSMNYNLDYHIVITLSRCKHFVRFEGAMTLIGINIVGLMMLVRIYALYNRQPWVVRGVAGLLLVEIGVYAWLLTTGVAVRHNRQVNSCTMIYGESNRIASSASAWLPLLYDTLVLVLTLRKTFPSIRKKNRHESTMYLLKRLLEDGLLYYSAIFAVTLALTIMIAVASSGLKNIVAQLELLITVAMMSRITLNLMKSHAKYQKGGPLNPSRRFERRSHSTTSPVSPTSPNGMFLSPPSPSKGKGRDRLSITQVEYAGLDPESNDRARVSFYSQPVDIALTPLHRSDS